jgi:peptidoglycan-associated lipoprotein
MNKRLWINLMTAIVVAGLFLTVSCAKKNVQPAQTTIQDNSQLEAEAKARQAAEAERIRAQELKEKQAKEQAMKEARLAQAKSKFLNENVPFNFDSAELSSDAKMILREKAAWLQDNRSVYVSIQGHCDERGTTEYNLALGERRAIAVKKYLSDLGVLASRMQTVSFGEEQPIDPAHNEAAWSKNRRAQFVLK